MARVRTGKASVVRYRNPATGRFARRGERVRVRGRWRNARPEKGWVRRDRETGQFARWRPTPKAPAGSAKIGKQVWQLIRRVGVEQAADLIGRSQKSVQRLANAWEAGKPLGAIIPSEATLARWQKDLRPAAVVIKKIVSIDEARAIIAQDEARGPEGLGWRLTLQRFVDRDEVNLRASDYIAGGVPGDLVRIVYDRGEGMYRIIKAKASPPKRR